MERPNLDDDAALTHDPAPSEPEATPRFPKPAGGNRDVRPRAPADNVKVTPLDDSEAIKKGIKINET